MRLSILCVSRSREVEEEVHEENEGEEEETNPVSFGFLTNRPSGLFKYKYPMQYMSVKLRYEKKKNTNNSRYCESNFLFSSLLLLHMNTAVFNCICLFQI